MLCQSNVPNRHHDPHHRHKRSHRDQRDDVAETDDDFEQKRPGEKGRDARVRAPEALTLIIVWPIIAQPPMPPRSLGQNVRGALGPGLAALAGAPVGDLVDELRGHQRLEQPYQRQ